MVKNIDMTDFDKKEHVNSPEGYREIAQKLIIGLEAGYDAIKTVLSMELPKQSEILVIGGGGGKELSSLHTLSQDWKFTILDPSKKMIKLAEYWVEHENLKERTSLMNGYIHDFDFSASSFDAITCIAVFHYLDKSERLNILKQVKEILKPNGIFILQLAVKPGTKEEFEYLKRIYLQYPTQNRLNNNMISNIAETLDTEYKMLSAKEESDMIESIGFKKPVEVFSTLFFKTYVIRKMK